MYILWAIARAFYFVRYLLTVVQLIATTLMTSSLALGLVSAAMTLLAICIVHWVIGVLINFDKELQ